MVSERISEFLCFGDNGLEVELDAEEEAFSNWAREQESLLLETVSQQQEVANQITELQRHVAQQQMEFRGVLERVYQLTGKPPTPQEKTETTWTEEQQVAKKLSVQEETPSQTFLVWLVDHVVFDLVGTCVICLNAIFIGVSVQYAVDCGIARVSYILMSSFGLESEFQNSQESLDETTEDSCMHLREHCIFAPSECYLSSLWQFSLWVMKDVATRFHTVFSVNGQFICSSSRGS